MTLNEIATAKCYVCDKSQIGNDKELNKLGWLYFADTNQAICKECKIKLSKERRNK